MICAEADRLRFSVPYAPLIANIKWWYEKQIYLSNSYNKNGDECFFLLVLKALIPALFGKVIPMITQKYHEKLKN